MDRAGIDTGAEIEVDVATDGPTTLRLDGGFDEGTQVVDDDGTVASTVVDGVLVIELDGERSLRVVPG